MTTGQTLLTLVGFMLLSTILLNFYRLMAASGDDIASGQDGILATSIATSYIEMAQGLSFDATTDTTDEALSSIYLLTAPGSLGRESSSEDSIHNFDDFDDFNNFTVEKDAGLTGRKYRTTFRVHYVNPANVEQILTVRTYLKRLDLTTWRIEPPPTPSVRLDTLRLSFVMGYFHFD
jgi:hypothetical protein